MKETLSLGDRRDFGLVRAASHLRTWSSLCEHRSEKTALFNPWREAKGRGRLQGLVGQCQVHDKVGETTRTV